MKRIQSKQSKQSQYGGGFEVGEQQEKNFDNYFQSNKYILNQQNNGISAYRQVQIKSMRSPFEKSQSFFREGESQRLQIQAPSRNGSYTINLEDQEKHSMWTKVLEHQGFIIKCNVKFNKIWVSFMQPFKSIKQIRQNFQGNRKQVVKVTVPGVILPNLSLVVGVEYGIIRLNLILMTNINTCHSISLNQIVKVQSYLFQINRGHISAWNIIQQNYSHQNPAQIIGIVGLSNGQIFQVDLLRILTKGLIQTQYINIKQNDVHFIESKPGKASKAITYLFNKFARNPNNNLDNTTHPAINITPINCGFLVVRQNGEFHVYSEAGRFQNYSFSHRAQILAEKQYPHVQVVVNQDETPLIEEQIQTCLYITTGEPFVQIVSVLFAENRTAQIENVDRIQFDIHPMQYIKDFNVFKGQVIALIDTINSDNFDQPEYPKQCIYFMGKRVWDLNTEYNSQKSRESQRNFYDEEYIERIKYNSFEIETLSISKHYDMVFFHRAQSVSILAGCGKVMSCWLKYKFNPFSDEVQSLKRNCQQIIHKYQDQKNDQIIQEQIQQDVKEYFISLRKQFFMFEDQNQSNEAIVKLKNQDQLSSIQFFRILSKTLINYFQTLHNKITEIFNTIYQISVDISISNTQSWESMIIELKQYDQMLQTINVFFKSAIKNQENIQKVQKFLCRGIQKKEEIDYTNAFFLVMNQVQYIFSKKFSKGDQLIERAIFYILNGIYYSILDGEDSQFLTNLAMKFHNLGETQSVEFLFKQLSNVNKRQAQIGIESAIHNYTSIVSWLQKFQAKKFKESNRQQEQQQQQKLVFTMDEVQSILLFIAKATDNEEQFLEAFNYFYRKMLTYRQINQLRHIGTKAFQIQQKFSLALKLLNQIEHLPYIFYETQKVLKGLEIYGQSSLLLKIKLSSILSQRIGREIENRFDPSTSYIDKYLLLCIKKLEKDDRNQIFTYLIDYHKLQLDYIQFSFYQSNEDKSKPQLNQLRKQYLLILSAEKLRSKVQNDKKRALMTYMFVLYQSLINNMELVNCDSFSIVQSNLQDDPKDKNIARNIRKEEKIINLQGTRKFRREILMKRCRLQDVKTKYAELKLRMRVEESEFSDSFNFKQAIQTIIKQAPYEFKDYTSLIKKVNGYKQKQNTYLHVIYYLGLRFVQSLDEFVQKNEEIDADELRKFTKIKVIASVVKDLQRSFKESTLFFSYIVGRKFSNDFAEQLMKEELDEKVVEEGFMKAQEFNQNLSQEGDEDDDDYEQVPVFQNKNIDLQYGSEEFRQSAV